MHSHLKRSRERTTNNHLGSPKAPHHLGDNHHGPRVAPGCHHGPGHAVGDANRTTERRCQRATTRNGPPTTATAIAIAIVRHDNDDNLGGPLCPPPPLSAGLHPGIAQKCVMRVRHSCATCTSSRNRDRARQHTDDQGGPLCSPPLSQLGNTLASRRSARRWVGTRVPTTDNDRDRTPPPYATRVERGHHPVNNRQCHAREHDASLLNRTRDTIPATRMRNPQPTAIACATPNRPRSHATTTLTSRGAH
jgi:hypothetical protein